MIDLVIEPDGIMMQSAEVVSQVKANTVVVAAGVMKPTSTWLKDYCAENGISYFCIGDSNYPRDIQSAILEGALLGRSL